MSVNIEQNVNKHLLNTKFSLQIDESTHISGKAQLIGFIRFILAVKYLINFYSVKNY